MSEHSPMPVAGYTAQSHSNVDLANELKHAEERYQRLLDKLRLNSEIDQRCVTFATKAMQEANMWAVRAIFQPQRISLPEDAK